MSFALAKIRGEECIGCTKCIAVCPVDAIIGSHNQLHFVLNQECIGCRLCVPACPVDCIEMLEDAEKLFDPKKAQLRHRARIQRLETEKNHERMHYQTQAQQAKNYLEQVLLRKRKKDDAEKN